MATRAKWVAASAGGELSFESMPRTAVTSHRNREVTWPVVHRTLCCWLPCALLTAAACGRGGFDQVVPDFRQRLPLLQATPTIDGLLERGAQLQDMAPVGWWGEGDSPDVTVRYAVSWRPDGLYFFVDVQDSGIFPAPEGAPGIYCGDSVELYADADGELSQYLDEPGATHLVVRAPDGELPSVVGSWYGNSYLGPWAGAFVSVATPNGYAVEAFVNASDLRLADWPLTEGLTVGLNISINASTPDGSPADCGVRAGQYYLSVSGHTAPACNGDPWCDARAMSTPRLVQAAIE